MQKRQYSASIFFSLFFHGLILAIFIVNFNFDSLPPVLENNSQDHIITAQAITESINKPVQNNATPEIKKIPAEEPKPNKEPVKSAEPTTVKPIFTERKKLVIQKPNVDKLLTDLKTAAKEKKKLAKKTYQKQFREQSLAALQNDLIEEHTKAKGRQAGEINKYKALILQAISRKWVIPGGINQNLTAELFIRLAPGGVVLDVAVTKSSGSIALDRSARDAVLRASPLPVPSDSYAFAEFRQFSLKVKPEHLIAEY